MMYKLIIVAIIIGLIMVGTLADKRGRSVVGWLCLSLLLTPFVCAVILLSTDKIDVQKEDLTVNQNGRYWIFVLLLFALFLTPLFIPSWFEWYNSAAHADYLLPSNSYESVYIRSFSCHSDKYEAIVENSSYHDIANLTFRVTYYEGGTQIDYHDYLYESTIEKGMTKTCLFERGEEYPHKYDKVEIHIIRLIPIEEKQEEERCDETNSNISI